MKKRLLVLAFSLFLFPFTVSIHAALPVGEAAPDFTLADSNGEAHSLTDYSGTYVVLEWCNHDCPFIRKHYESGNMQALQEEYTNRGVTWLTIGSSAHGKQGHYNGEEWNNLTEAKGATPSAVLLDPDGTVGQLYEAKTTPHMFVINPDGILIYQGAMDDNPSWKPETVEGAHNYVSAALESGMSHQAVEVPSTQSYGCSVKY